jgi:hypothetical protein
LSVAKRKSLLPIIGWREWVDLPELGLSQIKAKVDTGARSSALHAFDVSYASAQGLIQFKVHPRQRDTHHTLSITCPLVGKRRVRSSDGHVEIRPVIETIVLLAGIPCPIELTLTNRSMMGFRLLLGRQAVRGRFLVDSGKSFLLSLPQGSPK